MKTVYCITLPNGEKATRTSHRLYTHAIVADGLRADVRERQARSAIAYSQKMIAEYEPIVSGAKPPPARPAWLQEFQPMTLEQHVAEYAGYLAGQRKALAEQEAVLAAGFGPLPAVVLGWAGSPSLAAKRVSAEADRYANVRAVAAEVARVVQPRAPKAPAVSP